MSAGRALRWAGRSALSVIALIAFLADPGLAQRRFPQSPQDIPPRSFKVPPSPALSPQEELTTFKIAEGYHLQLVASEPLVHDPVSMSIDPDGRLWVCEMRDFMPDVDGHGESQPLGTVSVLEDTKGDGVFDKSTVFVDGLVLPRAVCWTSDGILVAENGNIWLCRDSSGGLHCDQKTLVCKYYPGNLEHALNGLAPMLDNWMYCVNEGVRLRKIDGKWVRDSIAPRGQWGITQDDHGYLVYNVNAQLLRGDLVPCYSPNAMVLNPLINAQFFKEQEVFPTRPNPGINRGYIASWLRADGSMIEANADCGPVVYRGDNLPRELLGNVFIPEPAGNLVRRQVFYDDGGGVKMSRNAYDKKEFIASTDERFRPVNMYNAPDGTLYLIDMYRGIIQHAAFITPYLRKDSLERGLEKPVGMGRIFRIVHDTTTPRKPPAMGKMTSAQLADCVSSPNGWTRDMAQQLLVQRGDVSIAPRLAELAKSCGNPFGRLHALWALEGLKKLDAKLLLALLDNDVADVRASAICLGRNLALRDPQSMYVDKLISLAGDPDKNVRMQLVFSLGMLNAPAADQAIEPMLREAAGNPNLLEGLLAGFAGHEVEFVGNRVLFKRWEKPDPWRQKLLSTTAGVLWLQRQPFAVLRLLDVIAKQPPEQAWQQAAVLDGLANPPYIRTGRGFVASPPRMINLPTVPQSLEKMRKSSDPLVVAAAEKVAAKLNWPGKDGKPLPVPPPLTAKQQALYDLGRNEYMNLCAACHNPAGFGDAGKAPPLIDSDWLDNEQRVVRLVLFGLHGPVSVNGDLFNRDSILEMPGMYNALDDQKIAGILTFVRREWREAAPPIDPETVGAIRAATKGKTDQWTAEELLKVK
jgi:mono/diheme cytochrome c family protein/glucose/arabinose dehydrogenase